MRLRKKKGVAEKLSGFDFVLGDLDESFQGHWREFFSPSANPSTIATSGVDFIIPPNQPRQSSTANIFIDNEVIKGRADGENIFLTHRPTSELHVELGIGKGDFISTIASQNPEINFVGLEAEPTVLYAAARKCRDLDLKNVRLAAFNVVDIDKIFGADEIDRLYINFCDPWPRNKHAKRRLTNINFLDKYRRILKHGAQLQFKTDNRPLFDYSLEQFKLLNLDVDCITFDLHADNPSDNIQTEYERKFSALGVAINRCVVHF